jgi:acyl-CoA thioester hydrolase
MFTKPDPATSSSTLQIRVRFCETDLMKIVHHAVYFTYFEAGRVEWLRRRGVTYSAWAEQGTHLPVAEVSAQYKLPAKFDDLLSLTTTLTELRSYSLRFAYLLKRGDAEIARAETRLACINDAGKLIPFPQATRDVLQSAETAAASPIFG